MSSEIEWKGRRNYNGGAEGGPPGWVGPLTPGREVRLHKPSHAPHLLSALPKACCFPRNLVPTCFRVWFQVLKPYVGVFV